MQIPQSDGKLFQVLRFDIMKADLATTPLIVSQFSCDRSVQPEKQNAPCRYTRRSPRETPQGGPRLIIRERDWCGVASWPDASLDLSFESYLKEEGSDPPRCLQTISPISSSLSRDSSIRLREGAHDRDEQQSLTSASS